MSDKKSKKIFFINVLNVLSCFCVVLLHCNGTVWQFEPTKHWIFQWIIETTCYFPVPIFFMITGVTLMDYREKYSTGSYVKKRLTKVGFPYIFWSIVSILWAVYYSEYLPKDYPLTFKGILDGIVNDKALLVYWFFPAILMVYALIPFVSMIPKELRTKAFSYLIIWDMLTNGVFYYIFTILGSHIMVRLEIHLADIFC